MRFSLELLCSGSMRYFLHFLHLLMCSVIKQKNWRNFLSKNLFPSLSFRSMYRQHLRLDLCSLDWLCERQVMELHDQVENSEKMVELSKLQAIRQHLHSEI